MRFVSPVLSASALSAFAFLAPSSAKAADAVAPAGDPARGDAYFRQACALCHLAGTGTAGGQGPSLVGVVGRRAASAPGFSFTPALTNSGLTWDAATLDRYLANPPAVVPGTSMVIPTPKPEDRRDLIAYLNTVRAPAVGAARGPAVDPNASDPNDWRNQKPGRKYAISADKLVAPFTSPSANNNPGRAQKPADGSLEVPAGFKVEQFSSGFTNPRIIRTAPNGDVFVAETGGRRISVMRVPNGATAPSEKEIFATGLDRPFGIAFFPAGENPQWVYVANNNSVVRFPYRNGDLKATGPAEVIVPKLSDTTGGHSTRDIAFSPDGKRLYISVGSASNYAENMPKKTPEEVRAWEAESARGAAWGPEARRANILVTDPEGKEPVRIFATGIRNPVGLAINPANGDLWTSTNERDGLGDDLVPDYVTSVKENGYYGWPWYYMGNHEEPRLKGERPDLAGKAIVPDVLLQAHSAALGITFYPKTTVTGAFPADYQGDLFVAMHGSWNRNSRTGYKVVRAKMQNGKPTGEYEDFLTGFVADARGVWGRPVGVTVTHDGALLVSEDQGGTIWRITRSTP